MDLTACGVHTTQKATYHAYPNAYNSTRFAGDIFKPEIRPRVKSLNG